MPRRETFTAVFADLPKVNMTKNKELIDWLRRLFEIVNANNDGVIPRCDEIASAITQNRKERPNSRLPAQSADRRLGSDAFAKWIITYALNILGKKPAQIIRDEDEPVYRFVYESRRFLGRSEIW